MYRVSSTTNAEVRLRFYEVVLRDATSEAAKQYSVEAADWIIGADGTGVIKGRMKFCRPTFRAVAKVNKKLALEHFNRSKDAFHPIARKLIEKVTNYYICFIRKAESNTTGLGIGSGLAAMSVQVPCLIYCMDIPNEKCKSNLVSPGSNIYLSVYLKLLQISPKTSSFFAVVVEVVVDAEEAQGSATVLPPQVSLLDANTLAGCWVELPHKPLEE